MPNSYNAPDTPAGKGYTPAQWRAMRRSMWVAIAITGALGVWLLSTTLRIRFERDAARMVFNDNTEVLEQVRLEAGTENDTLRQKLSALSAAPPRDEPVLVVSIAERRVWYKLGDSVIFTAQVATGSGKQLVVNGGNKVLRFETPRGRFLVTRRDSAPAWIPPEWHFQEQANKRNLGLVQLARGTPIPLKDGGQITVVGNDVVRLAKDGSTETLKAEDGREIVADGKIVIPPFGTNQRKYPGVLGSHRLYLGDGYALHGTNVPSSIGQAVSHGCVRLRNEDIAHLYDIVSVGTPVYIY